MTQHTQRRGKKGEGRRKNGFTRRLLSYPFCANSLGIGRMDWLKEMLDLHRSYSFWKLENLGHRAHTVTVYSNQTGAIGWMVRY